MQQCEILVVAQPFDSGVEAQVVMDLERLYVIAACVLQPMERPPTDETVHEVAMERERARIQEVVKLVLPLAALPDQILILDVMPRTGNGKVDTPAVLQLAGAGAATPVHSRQSAKAKAMPLPFLPPSLSTTPSMSAKQHLWIEMLSESERFGRKLRLPETFEPSGGVGSTYLEAGGDSQAAVLLAAHFAAGVGDRTAHSNLQADFLSALLGDQPAWRCIEVIAASRRTATLLSLPSSTATASTSSSTISPTPTLILPTRTSQLQPTSSALNDSFPAAARLKKRIRLDEGAVAVAVAVDAAAATATDPGELDVPNFSSVGNTRVRVACRARPLSLKARDSETMPFATKDSTASPTLRSRVSLPLLSASGSKQPCTPSFQPAWKVRLGKCIDATPLLVVADNNSNGAAAAATAATGVEEKGLSSHSKTCEANRDTLPIANRLPSQLMHADDSMRSGSSVVHSTCPESTEMAANMLECDPT